MELPEHLPLADLKKAIKAFKTEQTPKLSCKKSVLAEYAVKIGILKAKADKKAEAATQVKAEPVAAPVALPATAAKKTVKLPTELPEVLKAVKKVEPKAVKKPEPVAEAPKTKGSPFSAFMASNKGKGLSMSQLAELYRRQK